MCDIFIACTPYHILLSYAIASIQGNLTDRYLFIISDFKRADALVHLFERLCKPHFAKIHWLPGIYRKTNKFVQGIVIKKNVNTMRWFVNRHKVDRIYVFNDGGPESQAALYYGKLGNKNAIGVYVEDGIGAYTSYTRNRRSKFKMLMGRLFFGMPWKDISVLGTSTWIEEIFVIFPQLVRAELLGKRVKSISSHALLDLPNQTPLSDILSLLNVTIDEWRQIDAVLLLANSVYGNKCATYKQAIKTLVSSANNCGVRLAVKYHPSELKVDYLSIEGFQEILVIPKGLPAELVYIFLPERIKFIIGDLSTSLLTAKWLLSNVTIVSIAPFLGQILGQIAPFLGQTEIKLFETFRKLGIKEVGSFSEIKAIFHNELRHKEA